MIEHLKVESYEDISTKITDFYNSKGLDYQEPLGLVPGEDDKSVTFTSATINNFKKYLRKEEFSKILQYMRSLQWGGHHIKVYLMWIPRKIIK